jgi:hypothetical protein
LRTQQVPDMKKVVISFILITAISFKAISQNYHNYEQKMISSGPGSNFPDFYIGKDSLGKLLISLHNNMSPQKFQRSYQWTEEAYNKSISFLETKNFVKKLSAGRYVPTCMVITAADGEALLKHADPLARQMADLIVTKMNTVKDQYAKLDIAAKYPFDSLSFFILSDVLLDNWQIRNVENEFLRHPRPLRHGVNYYVALIENVKTNGRESFYGNQYGKDFYVYGNNRNRINQEEMKSRAASFPFISANDYSQLDNLAGLIKNDLIKIFETNRKYIEKIYVKTNYSKEITFEEFFIWWYHFIYTKATDILAQRQQLIMPASGNFFYRVK